MTAATVDVASLAARIEAARTSARHPGPACTVGAVMRDVTAADAKVGELLEGLINDLSTSAATVAELLTDELGKRISHQMVARHRKRGTSRGCRCTP